jgi:hypothetical protein
MKNLLRFANINKELQQIMLWIPFIYSQKSKNDIHKIELYIRF